MTDQKTTNDETAQDPSAQDPNNQDPNNQDPNAETGAQDPGGPDKAATDGTMDDILNDVLAAAGAETKGDADVQDPLTAMTAERDQLKDQLLRALADTENMRRRSEREAANVRKYGHTPFARDLVGAIDNLARVIESAPENLDQADETVKSLITGIQLSWTELQSVIEKHGIKRVEPLGEKFDYNLHQAMFEVPTNNQPSGIVLEVVQHGYVLHDRLLRPAMVGVSKAGDAAGATSNDQSKTDE
ncbi:nucleotide exchange factor GrpE [Alphaproteobacteria bacterium]|nr:nucleotide exchange factor GrpE [Alphaproteobacteria bacterium]MDC1157454.1 nucleotide exchange factor GrpE [Alphaproteobacteria bacterium]